MSVVSRLRYSAGSCGDCFALVFRGCINRLALVSQLRWFRVCVPMVGGGGGASSLFKAQLSSVEAHSPTSLLKCMLRNCVTGIALRTPQEDKRALPRDTCVLVLQLYWFRVCVPTCTHPPPPPSPPTLRSKCVSGAAPSLPPSPGDDDSFTRTRSPRRRSRGSRSRFGRDTTLKQVKRF